MSVRVIVVTAVISMRLVGSTYYVDCRDGNDAHGGTSISSPWKSLDRVNETTFSPGDSVLLRRGTECSGMLWPKGSGGPDRPVTIGAYGTGPLPVVDGGKNEAAIKLFNQQYWHIEAVETRGGSPYGICISGDKGVLRHFLIRNVVVRDVGGVVKTKNSGLVAVISGGAGQTFEDVVIDGLTAYNTTQWAGIIVNGSSFSRSSATSVRAKNVVVRNSTVHDVHGDGIILFQVENGLIEKCVTWNTGMQHSQTIGTPNAIWTWKCKNCLVQFNEGYLSDSPGVDGGVYDIDWGDENNVVQYNYAHDSQGYCVSVFGAGGMTTINSIVRYNLCVNNARSPRLAKRQGEVFLSTWDEGHLDGVQIYNNTIYWNPPVEAPALLNQAEFAGERPNIFKNNIIYSAVPTLIQSNGSLKLDHNLYWHTGAGAPEWTYGGSTFRNFSDYQQATGQEAHGIYADPRLGQPDLRLLNLAPAIDAGTDVGNMGRHDVFTVPIPQGNAHDIGALEFVSRSREPEPAPAAAFELEGLQDRTYRLADYRGKWLLLSFLDTRAEISRSQVVFLKSMLQQYGWKGLSVLIIGLGLPEHDSLVNLSYDWNLEDIPLLRDDESSSAVRAYRVTRTPATFLISPDSRTVWRSDGFATAPELGLTLRWFVGAPAGTPPVRVTQE